MIGHPEIQVRGSGELRLHARRDIEFSNEPWFDTPDGRVHIEAVDGRVRIPGFAVVSTRFRDVRIVAGTDIVYGPFQRPAYTADLKAAQVVVAAIRGSVVVDQSMTAMESSLIVQAEGNIEVTGETVLRGQRRVRVQSLKGDVLAPDTTIETGVDGGEVLIESFTAEGVIDLTNSTVRSGYRERGSGDVDILVHAGRVLMSRSWLMPAKLDFSLVKGGVLARLRARLQLDPATQLVDGSEAQLLMGDLLFDGVLAVEEEKSDVRFVSKFGTLRLHRLRRDGVQLFDVEGSLQGPGSVPGPRCDRRDLRGGRNGIDVEGRARSGFALQCEGVAGICRRASGPNSQGDVQVRRHRR